MLTQTPNGNATALRINRVVHTIDKALARHDKTVNELKAFIKRCDEYLQSRNIHKPLVPFSRRQHTNKLKQQIAPAKQGQESNEAILERCSHIYVFLEYLAKNQAHTFNDSDKGHLRKAQAHLTRIKLWMMDNASRENEDLCGPKSRT